MVRQEGGSLTCTPSLCCAYSSTFTCFFRFLEKFKQLSHWSDLVSHHLTCTPLGLCVALPRSHAWRYFHSFFLVKSARPTIQHRFAILTHFNLLFNNFPTRIAHKWVQLLSKWNYHKSIKVIGDICILAWFFLMNLNIWKVAKNEKYQVVNHKKVGSHCNWYFPPWWNLSTRFNVKLSRASLELWRKVKKLSYWFHCNWHFTPSSMSNSHVLL